MAVPACLSSRVRWDRTGDVLRDMNFLDEKHCPGLARRACNHDLSNEPKQEGSAACPTSPIPRSLCSHTAHPQKLGAHPRLPEAGAPFPLWIRQLQARPVSPVSAKQPPKCTSVQPGRRPTHTLSTQSWPAGKDGGPQASPDSRLHQGTSRTGPGQARTQATVPHTPTLITPCVTPWPLTPFMLLPADPGGRRLPLETPFFHYNWGTEVWFHKLRASLLSSFCAVWVVPASPTHIYV